MSGQLEQAAHELNLAVRERDAAAAAKLLHDEFALTSSLGTGLHVGKAAWLEGLEAIRTEELVARDAELREFGDVGVSVWRMDWRARLGDDDLSGPYVVSDVWLRGDDDGWRLRWRSWARLNAEFLREGLGA